MKILYIFIFIQITQLIIWNLFYEFNVLLYIVPKNRGGNFAKRRI